MLHFNKVQRSNKINKNNKNFIDTPSANKMEINIKTTSVVKTKLSNSVSLNFNKVIPVVF